MGERVARAIDLSHPAIGTNLMGSSGQHSSPMTAKEEATSDPSPCPLPVGSQWERVGCADVQRTTLAGSWTCRERTSQKECSCARTRNLFRSLEVKLVRMPIPPAPMRETTSYAPAPYRERGRGWGV